MDYENKIVKYTNPETNRGWLLNITSSERKRCKGDIFKHIYLSGRAVYLDPNFDNLKPMLDIRTGISGVRTKNIEVLLNQEEFKHLFD